MPEALRAYLRFAKANPASNGHPSSAPKRLRYGVAYGIGVTLLNLAGERPRPRMARNQWV
jgi:hypothetical protein